MFYEQLSEDEFQQIHFEVKVNNKYIQSPSSTSFEYAVKYLQKELPNDASIACCQSCQYGNFNPFGDNENEIFCLKDMKPLNRDDVVEIFSKQDKSFDTRSKKLLDFCKDYQSISESENYTYNGWGLEKYKL